MPITVDNIESFAQGLDATFAALDSEAAVQVFQSLGDEILQTARAYAPEYSGPTREGIYFQPGHLKSQMDATAGRDVATGAPHVSVGAPWYVGGFMEYGTEDSAAHPFMRPASDDWSPRVEGEIADKLAGLLP